MKLSEPRKERELNGNVFYIRPFPAFTSVNLSGEVFSFIMPILSAILPAVAASSDKEESSVLDIGAEVAAPALAKGASSVSGDKVELLLKKLLIKYKNIAVQLEGKDDAEPLTEDLANNIFAGDVQDMFILAYDVIQVNFEGFFKKVGDQFGSRLKAITENMKMS